MNRPATATTAFDGPEACPETDEVAQYAEGVLGARRRAALDAHLPGCDRCRSLLAGLARADLVVPGAAAGRGTAKRRRRRLWLPIAAAAAAAAVAGIVFALRSDEVPAGGTDAQLLALAQRLSETRPDLFAGFRPLDAAERSARGADVQRGGIELMAPAGLTVEPRPSFEWSAVAGAVDYEVALIDAEGASVLTTQTAATTLAASALPRDLARGGDYVWRVTARGAPGPAEGSRALHVAGEPDVRAFQAVVAAVAGATDQPLRDLATAHALVRRGFVTDALPFARRYAAARPDDPVGRDTVAWIRRNLAR